MAVSRYCSWMAVAAVELDQQLLLVYYYHHVLWVVVVDLFRTLLVSKRDR